MNIVNKLTLRHLKENKRRTAVTIIGVIISVAMIMGVITIVTSFSDMMKKREIAANGYWHVSYKNVNKDQIKKIKEDKNNKEIILSKDLGYALLNGSKNEQKPYLFIKEFNKEGFENYPVKLIKGRLPKDSNELVISSHISSNGKVNYNIGDTLNLDVGNRYVDRNEDVENQEPLNQRAAYVNNSEQKEKIVPTMKKEYKIVGIINRPTFEENWAPGYTVLSYVNENTSEKVDASVILNKLNSKLYDYSSGFAKANGINEVKFNNSLLKWSGIMNEESVREALFVVVIVLMAVIMIGSISLIYNAFAISVSERSKHLGMLSSVGATKAQKRNSVLFEAIFIGVISIPLGIIAGIIGIGVTFSVVNPLMEGITSFGDKMTLIVEPLGILLAAIISFATILISAYIPAIRASRITPIEAIRQTKDVKLTNKRVKTSKLTRKIFGVEGEIGLKNLKRNKGRYLTTIFSLVISIVLFLTVSTFSLYMKRSLELTSKDSNYDVAISAHVKNEKELNNIYIKYTSIKEIKDYSILKNLYQITPLDGDKLPDYVDKEHELKVDGKYMYALNIVSLNEESLKKYAKEVGADINALNDNKEMQGIVINSNKRYDKGKFIEGKCINAKEGDTIGVSEELREGQTKVEALANIKIGKLTDKAPTGISNVDFYGVRVIVSENTFSKMLNIFKDKSFSTSNKQLYIKSDNPTKLEESIKEVTKSVNEEVIVNSMVEQEKRSKQNMMLYSIFIYGFVALITAISIANIFNTISTSIALRRKEFAMLKSVGMTPASFNKMINYESIFYGIKSLAFGLPISFIVMILLYKGLSGGFGFPFIIPVGSIVVAILAVFLIVGISMMYSSSKIKKQNIIDALKQENI